MSHTPEKVKQYICRNCQVTHAGTPVHISAAEHTFEPPESCGACGESTFLEFGEWIHHHK